MKSSQIVFTAPGIAELVQTEIPAPAAGQVQVRIAVSAVSSGTERANLLGSDTLSWVVPRCEAVFPRVLGYSSAGVIEQVGEGVTEFAVGDRVALSWSTHTHLQNIAAANVTPIGEIPFEEAALFHIATFPLAALRKCKLELGESAIVMGMGILGLTAIKLLRAAGAAPVLAVDPDPAKREIALRHGADYALDPYAPDFAKTAKQLTGGGAHVGIEVTGIGAGLDGILDCMARFGRVALLGCTRSSDFTIDYYRKVHGPGITLVGAHTNARPGVDSSDGWWTEKDDMRALCTLSTTGRLKLAELLQEMHAPQAAPEVYRRLATEKTFPIVEFDWRKLQ